MQLSFLTNPNPLLEQKMRYFADYYQFANKYLGKLPILPFETPVSLLDKMEYQIQFNIERCHPSLDMYLEQLNFFNKELTSQFSENYQNLFDLFKINWIGRNAGDRKRWLNNEKNLLEILCKVKQEFDVSMFNKSIDFLYSYMTCQHSLDTHKENMQQLTHLIVTSFRLKGFSEEQVSRHITRIIKKKRNDFPFPLEILKNIDNNSFTILRDNFLSQGDFKSQFYGLINILDAYNNQSGHFLFYIEGIVMETPYDQNFKAEFDKVTFYSNKHVELASVRNVLLKKERHDPNIRHKVFPQFFDGDKIIAIVKLNFDKVEDGAVAAFRIIKSEAEYFFSYLGITNMMLDDFGYIFTEELTNPKISYRIILNPQSKSLRHAPYTSFKNAQKNAFEELRVCKSKAAKEILHNEFIHLKAFTQKNISYYWVFIENVFWKEKMQTKNVQSKFAKLSLKVLPDIFVRLNNDIAFLIENTTYWRDSLDIGLTKSEVEAIIEETTKSEWSSEMNWNSYLPKIKNDFLIDLIKTCEDLSSESQISSWEKYFINISQELFEFRNSELHAGIVNEYSRIKLSTILYYPMHRLRWKIIDYARSNPTKNYAEVISELLK